MNALRIDHVAEHFYQDGAEIDPYVVCDGVSIDTFNKYIGHGERLQVASRFLELNDNGQVFIVDLPTTIHESTSRKFSSHFVAATGNLREIAERGSMTARRAGFPNKEADDTFGPMGSTPNRTPPPVPRTIADWVTLAVEVGRSQSWASLERAALWWCHYIGIQYILLLKVSASAMQIEYRLYDIVTPGNLPPPLHHRIRLRNPERPADSVTFDMRRILSIPAYQPLPNGVNQHAVVNLRTVMNNVISSLQ